MITMYTAHTTEADEIADAIKEIKAQIDFAALKKHSVGIIFCHIDFVETGLIEALRGELPFEFIGMTSVAAVDDHGSGIFDLTLSVLTGDDVSFTVGMTGDIDHDNYEKEIDDLYKNIRGQAAADPAMIFTIMPYSPVVSGYELLNAMDRSCGGIPIWGSLTNNIDLSFNTVRTICNGESNAKAGAMLFLNGPVSPKFIVNAIPERNISNIRAVVTKCENATVLQEVNGMPVLEYLTTVVGLEINPDNVITTPLLAYYDNAEKPVVLGLYSLFEDGSLLVGGILPEGTSISVGTIDASSIFESGEATLKQVLAYPDRQATFLLPCITRYVMLSPDQEGEIRKVREALAEDGLPYALGYSGGEMCPLPDANGKLHNHFHSYTLVACIL